MSTRAEISGGAIFLPLHFDPGVAVVGLDDLVRHHVDVLLHDVVLELAADQALDREQGVVRIGDGLALGGLADQHFVVLGERDDRRRGAVAFAVLDHARLAAFHDRDARVGRAEVDADDFAHGDKLLKILTLNGRMTGLRIVPALSAASRAGGLVKCCDRAGVYKALTALWRR